MSDTEDRIVNFAKDLHGQIASQPNLDDFLFVVGRDPRILDSHLRHDHRQPKWAGRPLRDSLPDEVATQSR
jgi:hypothetical protein